MAGIDEYRKGLRAAIRGLWNGSLRLDQARDAFNSAIERRLTQAWAEGAAECNIAPDELSQAEIVARDEFIGEQIDRAPVFLDEVNRNLKGTGKLAPQYRRVELWVNQYNSVRLLAESMACADEKREWVLGATEHHCRTCPRLNGQVRRMSFWRERVLPRNGPNDKLECKGYRCLCTLRKTDKPISRGPLPKIP